MSIPCWCLCCVSIFFVCISSVRVYTVFAYASLACTSPIRPQEASRGPRSQPGLPPLPPPVPRLAQGLCGRLIGQSHSTVWDAYADDPSTQGARVTPHSSLEAWTQEAGAAGLHVALLAIGDRAVEEVVYSFWARRGLGTVLSMPSTLRR